MTLSTHAKPVRIRCMEPFRSEQGQFNAFNRVGDVPVFKLFLQPIRCLHNIVSPELRLRGEVLMRIVGPDGALESPVETIARHERVGTMPLLDLAVMRVAFESLRKLKQHSGRTGINVSACSISDARFSWFVQEELKNSGVSPHLLCFEITETAAIEDMRTAKKNARSLRELGIAIALDDFQTGHSTDEYLNELPVDYVKISGLHTMSVLDDVQAKQNIERIGSTARRAGALTIAEWVTKTQQMFLLADLGVDMAQGDAVGPSVPM
jgi:EAL domain-containing protein (putative c-di-GMP-specific phosphodiesterase class I)